MNLTRRDLAAAGVFALSTTTLILPAMAATDDEEAVKQAVEALRKAMLTQDKAKLETLTAEQLSYSHSDARLEDKAKFINAIMTRKAVFKSLQRYSASSVGVGKRTRRQSYQHQDRRPAGLAEAGQQLEVVGACVLQVAGASRKILASSAPFLSRLAWRYSVPACLASPSPRGVAGAGLQNNLAATEPPENEATPLVSPHLTEPSTTRLEEVSSHQVRSLGPPWENANMRPRAKIGKSRPGPPRRGEASSDPFINCPADRQYCGI